MNLETETKLYNLRATLNSISDASYAYKNLSKNHRVTEIDEDYALKLIEAYEGIINRVINSIQNS